jgi:L-threonylcarbamoyladenylate synthase
MKTNNVFVYPTETSYGIGCDARNVEAVKKIFKIKGRDAKKTVTLIAFDKKMVLKYVAKPVAEIVRVMDGYWPGPLTLVLPANAYARKMLAPGIIRRDGTIGIRVSANKIARELSQHIGGPIVATSANQSGEPACYSISAVRRAFMKSPLKPDIVIDEGRLPKRPASTIARYKNKKWEIIRPGSIHL